jgi:DNA polymerase I
MIWVLVDFSYIAYRAYHSMHGLSHGDIQTGVLYGFFEELRSVCFDPRIKSNKVALFLDSRQSYRKRLFPAYKQKRHEDKTPEEMQQVVELHRQMDLLVDEILPTIGLPTYRQTGLESDDLIARVCEEDGEHVIVTADGDLYQCISVENTWFDPARNLWLSRPTDLLKKKGVYPLQWSMIKALSGCHSDGVPGIPGIGEKTAIKYSNHTLPKTSKKFKAIESKEGQEIIKRNFQLVHLPHAKTGPVLLREPSYNPAAFFTFCKKYGMQSYLDGPRHREWLAFFHGDMEQQNLQTARKRGERRK